MIDTFVASRNVTSDAIVVKEQNYMLTFLNDRSQNDNEHLETDKLNRGKEKKQLRNYTQVREFNHFIRQLEDL